VPLAQADLRALWRQIFENFELVLLLYVSVTGSCLLQPTSEEQPMIVLLARELDPFPRRDHRRSERVESEGQTAIRLVRTVPAASGLAVSFRQRQRRRSAARLRCRKPARESRVILGCSTRRGRSVAGGADSGGFWYTRYPGRDRPPRSSFLPEGLLHRIGDKPAKDAYVLGQDFPKVAEISWTTGSTEPRLVRWPTANGGEYAHYVIAPDGSARQVTHFEDKVVAAVIGPDDQLYLVSRKDASAQAAEAGPGPSRAWSARG